MVDEFFNTKEDYERNRAVNVQLIKNNLLQIEMAKKVISYFDEKIAEFPKEEDLNNP
jgi:hypothetical protein